MADEFKACSVEGCKKNASPSAQGRRGMCCSHRKRLQRHGDPLAGGTAFGAPLAFLLDVMSTETDECIAWPFGRVANGYGEVRIDGAMCYVHRVVCTKAHGEPPTLEHQAAHGCGNRICANPRHLRWATRSENEADKLLHGTDDRGEKANGVKLTEVNVQEIRRLRGAVAHVVLAKRFGVCRSNISAIQRRKIWAWLE